MIGVIASCSDAQVVREFFELFKTPWEFYNDDRQYEVVLLCAETYPPPKNHAKLTVIYYSDSIENAGAIDLANGHGKILIYKGSLLPIYGEFVSFQKCVSDILVHEDSRRSVISLQRNDNGLVAQVGYNLFHEVRVLLTVGQPAVNAALPALELHIALLRDLVLTAGVQLIEIPPVPNGYNYIACLTHDVDHPTIRLHFLDHTMFGFLYRAVIKSFIDLVHWRISLGGAVRNWLAVLKLPFVYLGLAKDTWDTFDRYVEIERGAGSTFFIIPFKNSSGSGVYGDSPVQRASRYSAADISDKIRKLISSGCEIGLHGIDAWLSVPKGRAELQEIRRFTGKSRVGSRMHWLYFDAKSAEVLEELGIEYDSTSGYNETIGYRAGTTQVYKPLGVARLVELPLHIMDTALFFPGYLNLSRAQAWKQVDRIIENAVLFGGCVTVNWHDRSIAPERLWGDFYVGLLDKLRDGRAWFTSAGRVVSWFRNRRSVVFESIVYQGGTLRATLSVDVSSDLPDLELRLYGDGDQVRRIPISIVNSGRGFNTIRRTIEICYPVA